MPTKKTKWEYQKNPFVEIAASVAGIYMVIVIFTLMIARDQTSFLVPVAWAFAFLGAATSYFASKK